jgi:hypothetical protein
VPEWRWFTRSRRQPLVSHRSTPSPVRTWQLGHPIGRHDDGSGANRRPPGWRLPPPVTPFHAPTRTPPRSAVRRVRGLSGTDGPHNGNDRRSHWPIRRKTHAAIGPGHGSCPAVISLKIMWWRGTVFHRSSTPFFSWLAHVSAERTMNRVFSLYLLSILSVPEPGNCVIWSLCAVSGLIVGVLCRRSARRRFRHHRMNDMPYEPHRSPTRPTACPRCALGANRTCARLPRPHRCHQLD